MNTLYVELCSGLSSDIFLGALYGLASVYDKIVDLPEKLNLPDRHGI